MFVSVFVLGCAFVVVVLFCFGLSFFLSFFFFFFFFFKNLVDGNLLGKREPDVQTGDAKRNTFPTYSLYGGQCRSITP